MRQSVDGDADVGLNRPGDVGLEGQREQAGAAWVLLRVAVGVQPARLRAHEGRQLGPAPIDAPAAFEAGADRAAREDGAQGLGLTNGDRLTVHVVLEEVAADQAKAVQGPRPAERIAADVEPFDVALGEAIGHIDARPVESGHRSQQPMVADRVMKSAGDTGP